MRRLFLLRGSVAYIIAMIWPHNRLRCIISLYEDTVGGAVCSLPLHRDICQDLPFSPERSNDLFIISDSRSPDVLLGLYRYHSPLVPSHGIIARHRHKIDYTKSDSEPSTRWHEVTFLSVQPHRLQRSAKIGNGQQPAP